MTIAECSSTRKKTCLVEPHDTPGKLGWLGWTLRQLSCTKAMSFIAMIVRTRSRAATYTMMSVHMHTVSTPHFPNNHCPSMTILDIRGSSQSNHDVPYLCSDPEQIRDHRNRERHCNISIDSEIERPFLHGPGDSRHLSQTQHVRHARERRRVNSPNVVSRASVSLRTTSQLVLKSQYHMD